jgi:transcription termination/antitermination protein NusG
VNTAGTIPNKTYSLAGTAASSWYAVHTRSRHEKLVAFHLLQRGVERYLPTVIETHRWSDRRQKVELPLFPGYVFVQIVPTNETRVEVLRTPGVVAFVGNGPEGTAIPAGEIEAVRTLIEKQLNWLPHPFLREGQRVRIRGGSLDGVEGIFLKRNGQETLLISVAAIQRSLSISVQGYDVESLN